MLVFQQEAILNTRFVYLKQIGVSSQIIYSIFLLFILIAIGLLPFLSTAISVSGRGIIQSADSIPLATCYVSPSDIGLISKGQSVRLQIDVFDSSQWGTLTGKVVDISDNVFIQDQESYFIIKCHLNKGYLKLRSGYKGLIKKGMTFKVRFMLKERSFYHLLFDKASDWF